MRLYSYLFCVFTACLLLVGCKPAVSAKNTGAIYCVDSFSQYLNPQILGSSPFVASLSQQVYNRLIEINPVTQRLDSALAERWSVSRSGLIYTFDLKQNIQFHHTTWFSPTRTMNADDVVFSFNRIIDQNNPYHIVSGSAYPFFDNLRFSNVLQSVRKINDYEVQFILIHPDASFMATLASDYAVILSAEYAEQLKKQKKMGDIDEYPVGTGPYQLLEKRTNEYLRLTQNPNYWGPEPKLEQIVFDYTPRASKRLQKLFTGECQVIATPAASQLPFIRDNPRTELDIQNSMNSTILVINTKKKPLNNLKVRQAIAMAINRDNLQQAVFFDTGEAASSLLPPASWAHNPNLDEYYFNPQKAIKMLAEAGYPNGFDLTLWVQPIARTYNPDASKTAQLIQGDLARIGIDVEIIEPRWSYMREHLIAGDHDLALLSWIADNDDPDNFLRPLLSCKALNNFSGWCNEEFDSTLDKALSTQRLSDRINEYHRSQELIYEEVPVIPLAHALMVSAYLKSIHDIIMPPTGGVSFKKAYREE